MKSSIVLPIVLCVSFTALHSTAYARIGESRSEIEARLFGSGKTTRYTNTMGKTAASSKKDSKPPSERGNSMLSQKIHQIPHYGALKDLIEKDALDVQVYHKVVNGNSASAREIENNDAGDAWDVAICYRSGVSVYESYSKRGEVSEIERKGLMNLQSGGSPWITKSRAEELLNAVAPAENASATPTDSTQQPESAAKPTGTEGEEKVTSVQSDSEDTEESTDKRKTFMTQFGFSHIRKDGKARATIGGNQLIFFSSSLDSGLARKKKNQQQAQAPESLKGF